MYTYRQPIMYMNDVYEWFKSIDPFMTPPVFVAPGGHPGRPWKRRAIPSVTSTWMS